MSYPEATIVGLKQMAELGVKAKMFGADTWGDPKIATDAGKAAEGIMYSVPKAISSAEFNR